MAEKHHLRTQSGINQKGEPFLQLIHDSRVIAQMNPEEARAFARALLETAEASEQDAFMFDWVCNKVGSGPNQAVGLLQDFRAWREERTGKKSGVLSKEEWVMPEKGSE